MEIVSLDLERRTLIQMAAGLAVGGALGVAPAARTAIAAPAPTGQPGDFDFLAGDWRIQHRQWKNKQWDLFTGEATVFGILGGIASIEELRIPERGFSGMGLRLLDVQRKLWADFWVSSQSGVLGSEPTWGSFTNGVGTWDADDADDAGKPIVVRGCWDQITPTSCRWYQATSRDGGKSWEQSWVMQWTRRGR